MSHNNSYVESPQNTILFGDKVIVDAISYNEAVPEECGPLTCPLKNGKFGHRRTYKIPWDKMKAEVG